MNAIPASADDPCTESDMNPYAPFGETADGIPLNEIGDELGMDGWALTDDEKDCFCSW